MTWAVVRVRGEVDVHPKVKDTLKMLNLHRPNHCVIVPEERSFEGMLNVVKDHVTWGEADPDVLSRLLSTRARLVGDEPLTDDAVDEGSDFGSIGELAEALSSGKATLKDVEDLKPVIRLHPPRTGYGPVKRPFHRGGALGYRGEEINELLERMVTVQHG